MQLKGDFLTEALTGPQPDFQPGRGFTRFRYGFMKVLVQDSVSLLFLCSGATWCDNDTKATDFLHTENAIAFCYQHRGKPYQVRMRFSDPEYDIVIPIDPQAI